MSHKKDPPFSDRRKCEKTFVGPERRSLNRLNETVGKIKQMAEEVAAGANQIDCMVTQLNSEINKIYTSIEDLEREQG